MTKRYDALDGIRGVAAICVMVMHATGTRFMQNSYIAVDFFFILSGFVIAHAYGKRVGRLGLAEFMLRRLIRLYPMFLFGMLLAGLSFILARRSGMNDSPLYPTIASFLLNLFYVPFLSPIHVDGDALPIFPLNTPYWSLFFELVANLFFINLFRFSRRSLATFVAVSFLAIIVISILLALQDNRFGVAVDSGWGTSNFVGGGPRVFYGFSCGILLYKLMQDRRFGVIQRFAEHVPGRTYLILLVTFALLLAPPVHGFGALYYLLVVGLVAPLIVAAASSNCESTTASGICRTLGWLSYPIYCLHIPIINMVQSANGGDFGVEIGMTTIACAITVAAAGIVTRIYEEPVRAWLIQRAYFANRAPGVA